MKIIYPTLFLCCYLVACKGEDMQMQGTETPVQASLNYANVDILTPDKIYNLLDINNLTEAPEIASWAGATAFVSDYETKAVKENRLDEFWIDAQILGLNREQYQILYHTTIQVAAVTEYEFTRLWWGQLNTNNNPSLSAISSTIEEALLTPQGKVLAKKYAITGNIEYPVNELIPFYHFTINTQVIAPRCTLPTTQCQVDVELDATIKSWGGDPDYKATGTSHRFSTGLYKLTVNKLKVSNTYASFEVNDDQSMGFLIDDNNNTVIIELDNTNKLISKSLRGTGGAADVYLEFQYLQTIEPQNPENKELEIFGRIGSDMSWFLKHNYQTNTLELSEGPYYNLVSGFINARLIDK